MVSRTASTCNRYAAGCTKTSAEILWVKRRKKQRNAPDFRRKQPKSGAFWVLEGVAAVGNRGERMGKPSDRTRVHPIPIQHMQKENRRKPRVSAGFVAGAEGLGLGCRLGRLVACVPPARTRPTTRTAQGAAVPCCQILPHTNEKSQVPQKRYLTFLAGAEGLEPSARGFGVDVGKCAGERGRSKVELSSRTSSEKMVLVWCCGEKSGPKHLKFCGGENKEKAFHSSFFKASSSSGKSP